MDLRVALYLSLSMLAANHSPSVYAEHMGRRVRLDFSAFAAMRALRDQLRERLDQNEDYRAWKALDEALRDLELRTLPQALDFALGAVSSSSQPVAYGRKFE